MPVKVIRYLQAASSLNHDCRVPKAHQAPSDLNRGGIKSSAGRQLIRRVPATARTLRIGVPASQKQANNPGTWKSLAFFPSAHSGEDCEPAPCK